MTDFEKLGAFFLGKRWDPVSASATEDLVLYDAKDLTTHAVCVGMTGSGKTGLCVALLEEAAIDGVPAIVIDPKGDLANLLLTFPDLAPSDFRPWIDEAEAARSGVTPDKHAELVAKTWRDGLASWGQDGERIRRLRASCDFALYTPGSLGGRPLAALRSLAAPPPAAFDDPETVRDRVQSAVSGLLTLVGIDADPVRSREHILLSQVVETAWRAGRDLDLAALIGEVQEPSIRRFGVLDLETFLPAERRFDLAMRLNNLLAAPGFAAWTRGEPLDPARLLWTEDGRPRVSVLSIAHLSDRERMFFVTLLLNETVAWMRTQPGTASLRAILYMDEVFGYFPPSAEPPSKRPMLTLLKQARAHGLGVVLATQNPVDLDYKGLSNAGTWFLGRLQTERDKARVLDGLDGASTATGASFDRAAIDRTLSGLGKRVFLLHNVHEDGPVLVHTRWVMSYLRGPLTHGQLRQLAGGGERTDDRPVPSEPAVASAAPSPSVAVRPTVPPGIVETFLAPRTPPPPEASLRYVPALLGTARVHFVHAKSRTDVWVENAAIAPVPDAAGDPWADGNVLDRVPPTHGSPYPASGWEDVAGSALSARSYDGWARELKDHLYRERRLTLWSCPKLRSWSEPGETEGAFRARLVHAARETRDVAVEALRKRYAPKLAAVQDRIRRAEDRIDREQDQYRQQKTQTLISVGAGVLGALFGRKLASAGNVGRAATAARGAGRAAREKEDVRRAERDLEVQLERKSELETRLQDEIADVEATVDPTALELEAIEIAPRKSDIDVVGVVLAWIPHDGDRSLAP